MSRSSGTGLLHSRSLSLFYIFILFFFCLHSRTVLAAPIYKEYMILHRRNVNANSNVSILCTKSQTTSNTAPVISNIKTIIQTDFATETEVITKTVIGGGGSTSSRAVVVETTSIFTTVQSSGPVVSDIGTEPGAVFSTPAADYTSSSSESTSTAYVSYSTLSRPAITMIASPPVALVPTNEPEERPAPSSSSEALMTTTSSIESSTSTASESSTSGVPTISTDTTTTSIETTTTSTSTPIISSTSTSSTSTPDTSSMASNIIIPIETLQPSLDSETTSLPLQSSSLTTTTSTIKSQPTTSTSPSPSTSSPAPPKTGYILTGILLPQPSDLPAAQSTRIQLDGGVAMPTSTSGAQTDLNGPPELVFRGDAGRSISIRRSIGVWGVTGAVAVILGVVVV